MVSWARAMPLTSKAAETATANKGLSMRKTPGRDAVGNRWGELVDQATSSLDWMRATPALAICAQAAFSEPFRSMPRQASSITAALKPALQASSAVHETQKSVARPHT